MASDNQITANRNNAKKSTGPKTGSGKAASSMNALRHGFFARAAVLPGEDRDEFNDLCNSFEAFWQPQNGQEHFVLQQMVVAAWRMGRACAAAALNSEPAQESANGERLDRRLARLERLFSNAMKNLRSLQKERLAQQRQSEDEDDEEDDPNLCEGLAWHDPDGTLVPVVAPAVRGPDGKWHDITPEEWERLHDERSKKT